ncbi:MAG: SUMF1/EgtB/PvdO family nonheme iron enzyme [Fuerstiella sp.]
MRHMLFALLLVAVVGCGNSDTSPDEQAVKPGADTAESTNAAKVEPQATSQSQTQAGDPIVNSIGMSFVSIPAGTFTMGDANGEVDETPHQVTLTKGFELGVYEVTQEQYEQVMGSKDRAKNKCRVNRAIPL